MPLKYNLKDQSAPLGDLEIHQIDMLRFHMGADRSTGIQDPPNKDEIEARNTGLEILCKLMTRGIFPEIVEKVLDHLDGTDLTALQIGHPILDNFIKEMFWTNEKKSKILTDHWNNWFPRRTRIEEGVMISCLAQNDLKICCGLKSGKIIVYDQNLWKLAELDKHKKEVTALEANGDLLLSVSKDMDLAIWSVSNKVLLSRLQLGVNITSIKMHGDKIFVGVDTGSIMVFLHMGRGDIVHQQSISGHVDNVTAIDANDKYFVTGGKDRALKVWSFQDYKLITCVKLKFPIVVTGSRGSERSVRIWNIRTAECLRFLRIENNVRTIDFDKQRLVTGDDDGYLVFWDLAKCLDPNSGPESLSYRSHNTYVEGSTSGVILVGSCLLISSSGKNGQLTVHDYWSAVAEDPDHTDSW